MNTFDFYVIKAIASAKTPLKPLLAIAGGKIDSRKTGYKQYGYNSYPVYEYSISLGYVDVAGKKQEEIDAEVKTISDKFTGHPGVRVLAIYVPRD